MFKRLFTVILILAMGLMLVSCGNSGAKASDNEVEYKYAEDKVLEVLTKYESYVPHYGYMQVGLKNNTENEISFDKLQYDLLKKEGSRYLRARSLYRNPNASLSGTIGTGDEGILVIEIDISHLDEGEYRIVCSIGTGFYYKDIKVSADGNTVNYPLAKDYADAVTAADKEALLKLAEECYKKEVNAGCDKLYSQVEDLDFCPYMNVIMANRIEAGDGLVVKVTEKANGFASGDWTHFEFTRDSASGEWTMAQWITNVPVY